MDKVITVKHSVLLISDYGLLSWINSIDTDSYKPILLDLVQLLFTSSNLLVEDIKIKNQVNTNLTNVIQVLNILMKILPAINLYKSIELFNTYLKIVFNCMSLFINQKENEWFVLNKHKLQEIIDTGFQILRSDFSKFCKVPFYYREYNNNNIQVEANQNLKNAVFIFHLLMNKQIE